MRIIAGALMAVLLAASSAAAAATSVSGTLVNIASYISGDATATTVNMGAMMGNGQGYGMMNNGSGTMMNGYQGQGMYGCRSALGVVTSDGKLYVLIVDTGGQNLFQLCSEVGSHVTVGGTLFQKGGMRAIRVESASTQ